MSSTASEQHASPSSSEAKRAPLRIVFFFEVDTGGSWRPRTNHVGTRTRRWILGPISVGYFRHRNINMMLDAATKWLEHAETHWEIRGDDSKVVRLNKGGAR